MYEPRRQPQTIGHLLDSSVELYRATFLRVFTLALFALAPSALVSGIDMYTISAATDIPGTGTLAYVLTGLLAILFYGAMVNALGQAALGQSSTMGEDIGIGTRKLLLFLMAAILYALATAGGFILLIIPGLYIMISLMLFPVPMFLEDQGPIDSLKQSFRAVRGNWWRAVAVIVVISLAVIALYVVIIALLGIALGVGAGGLVIMGETQPSEALGVILMISVAQVTLSALLYPLLFAVTVVLYHDFILRNDLAPGQANAPPATR